MRSIFGFISLAPSMGRRVVIYELILSQTIVLLPINLLSLDGLRTSTTPRSCGDGSTDPCSNSKCTRADEAEQRVEALSLSKGQ